MSWRKVTFRAERVMDGFQLQQDFTAVFMANGAPADAALFTDHNVHPEYVLYFNPGASRIAAALLDQRGAIECEDPGPVALLVGHQAAYYAQNKIKK